jgi:hypothetical protein
LWEVNYFTAPWPIAGDSCIAEEINSVRRQLDPLWAQDASLSSYYRSVVVHQVNNIEGLTDSRDIEDAIESGTRRALDEDARRQETLVRDAFVEE